MASHQTETVHAGELDSLVASSGLQCTKSPAVTPPSEEEYELEEEIREEPLHEAIEEVIDEEYREGENETLEEEDRKDGLFPTPSLRRMIPERLRRIESHDRIHVLPNEFKTDIDPKAIPKINSTAPQKYIDMLAEIVGCEEYKSSLAEFWFLDTLANLLRRAQEDFLDRSTQAVLILWWCEWMKEIQNFDAADRPRMMKRFEENMLSAARFIASEGYLPTPDQAGVYYTNPNDRSKTSISKGFVITEGGSYECALMDLTKILHYIYDVFSTPFQFDLIRSIFTFTPDYTIIDAPYQIQIPKQYYQVIKPKKEKEGGKKDEKKGKKGKEKETELPEEYLYLMSVKAREEQDLKVQEEIEREQWNRKSHILPLNFTATEELFDQYWPPPPPPPPEPEPEPVPVSKKDAKKKKK